MPVAADLRVSIMFTLPRMVDRGVYVCELRNAGGDSVDGLAPPVERQSWFPTMFECMVGSLTERCTKWNFPAAAEARIIPGRDPNAGRRSA
jgi:hypothetical protein